MTTLNIFLRKVISVFQNTKIGFKGAWKPFQTGVYLTTMSILGIQHLYLNSYKFKHLMLRRFMQDAMENLFLYDKIEKRSN